MLATLPRKNADSTTGELFVSAYNMHLSGYPASAIEYLAKRATGELRWFPTIAECKEILSQWVRDDMHAKRKAKAQVIAVQYRLRNPKRKDGENAKALARTLTQDDVDAMNPPIIRLGVACGALIEKSDGTYAVNPESP